MGTKLVLTCDMKEGCTNPVTHLGEKGYVYCAAHVGDRVGWERCRKLTARERKHMEEGGTLASYDAKRSLPPKPHPARARHGEYVAVFTGIEARFAKDPLATACWDVRRGSDGAVVGRIYVGGSYPEPHFNLSKLVNAGPYPEGVDDPKSEHYGMCFDGSPVPTIAEALAEFAKRADRLTAWRAAKPFAGFYASVPKALADMNGEELRQELDALARTAETCREMGHGISTKEGIRFQNCLTMLRAREITHDDEHAGSDADGYETRWTGKAVPR